MELGDFLLPKQITRRSGRYSPGPVRLVAEPGIFDNVKAAPKLVKNDGVSAEWVCTGESEDCAVGVKLVADCDGFCWYELTLTPKRAPEAQLVTTGDSANEGHARYLHTAEYDWSNVSGGLAEMGGNWSGHFIPYVWLGDEERGLAWCAESNAGWRLAEPGRALGVETRGYRAVHDAI